MRSKTSLPEVLMMKKNKHVGSSLDDFLKEEGVLEETRSIAIKEALARRFIRG